MPGHRKWMTPRVTRSSTADFIPTAARKREVEGLLAVRDLVHQALDLIEESEAAGEAQPKLRALLAEIDAELMTTQER